MPHYQSLSKNERLKSYRKIRLLFDQGARFRLHPFVVYFSIARHEEAATDNEVLQMGVSVGTRHFKKAVDRNLLKRRIREAYRKNKQELKETLLLKGYSMVVFFVYTNTQITDYTEIELAIKMGLNNLIKSTNQQINP